MLQYFIKRVLLMIPKILLITIIIFIGIKLVPGDSVDYLIPASKAAELGLKGMEELREVIGLNDSYVTQYFRWMGNLLQGDLGYSHINGASISSMVAARFPITIELCLISLLFSSLFGIIFGYISAIRHNKPIDYALTACGMIGISVPEFFFGLILIMVFAIELGWLPTGGRLSVGQPGFFQRLDHLILPCACLGIGLVANLMRYVKNSMMDTLHMEYIKTARSKGLSPIRVNIRHSFRNAMIPIMSILVGRITLLIGGSVAIETIFNFPGMGKLLLDSVNNSDLPTVMIMTLLLTVSVLFATLLTDLFSAMLDPRIRMGQSGT